MQEGINFEAQYTKHLPWIRRKAKELVAFYAPYSFVDEDDLEQAALIELAKAVERYDSDKKLDTTSPSAYFRICMLGQMLNEAKNCSRLVHIPVSVMGKAVEAEEKWEEDLADYKTQAIYKAKEWLVLCPEDASGEIVYELMLEKMVEAETEILRQEERERVIDAMLNTLTPREERFIRLYYGFGDEIEKSLDQVGHLENLSRSRVSQIIAKGVRKLRHPARAVRLMEVV